jgi:hypothetical protein
MTPLPADYVRRVVYGKYLLRRARELLRHRTLLATAEALLALHDGAEMVMRVVGDHLRVKQFHNFMEFWGRVKDVNGSEPTHRAAMERLNDTRNSFKHKGVPPDRTVVSGFQALVEEFCGDLCMTYLGRDFSTFTLSSLISKAPVRELLNASEVIFEGGKVKEALEKLALAYDKLKTAAEGESNEVLVNTGLSVHLPDSHPMLSRIESSLIDLARNHNEVAETINMLLLGVDPHSYLFFRKSMPVIIRAGQLAREEMLVWPSDNVEFDPQTYPLCRDFVIEFSLRNDELFKP